MKFVMIFIDGLGIGTKNPQWNPCLHSQGFFNIFSDEERIIPLPFGGLFKGLDASLEMPGLPQSATGQTAIFTGINAAQILGYHLNGFPNTKLREILLEYSLLKKIKERGHTVDFLNTYRPIFFDKPIEERFRRVSCSTLTTLAAEINFHSQKDLFDKISICHDLTNQIFIEQGFEAPIFTPSQSGRILAQSSAQNDFVLFEFFLTDFIGHAQDMNRAQSELNKLEEFLISFLSEVNLSETTVLLISDHGNLEDLSTKSHTLNPAIFLTWGQHSKRFHENCVSIQDPYHEILAIYKT